MLDKLKHYEQPKRYLSPQVAKSEESSNNGSFVNKKSTNRNHSHVKIDQIIDNKLHDSPDKARMQFIDENWDDTYSCTTKAKDLIRKYKETKEQKNDKSYTEMVNSMFVSVSSSGFKGIFYTMLYA